MNPNFFLQPIYASINITVMISHAFYTYNYITLQQDFYLAAAGAAG
jgi:hypothetical protein